MINICPGPLLFLVHCWLLASTGLPYKNIYYKSNKRTYKLLLRNEKKEITIKIIDLKLRIVLKVLQINLPTVNKTPTNPYSRACNPELGNVVTCTCSPLVLVPGCKRLIILIRIGKNTHFVQYGDQL